MQFRINMCRTVGRQQHRKKTASDKTRLQDEELMCRNGQQSHRCGLLYYYLYLYVTSYADTKQIDIESDKQRMWMESGDGCSGDGGGRQ